MSIPHELADVVVALRAAGMTCRPHPENPNANQARCPCCTLFADGEVLLVAQNGKGTSLRCATGCPEDKIAARIGLAPSATGTGARTVGLRPAADIRPMSPEWAWTRRVPLGNVTLFAGREGLGKSTGLTEIAGPADPRRAGRRPRRSAGQCRDRQR